MKCNYDKCDNELVGRQRTFCSDRCRMAQTRTGKEAEPEQCSTLPKPEQANPGKAILHYGQPDCQCQHCKQVRANRSQNTINHGPYKSVDQLAANEVNRVSLPGDPNYAGVCLQAAQFSPK